MRRGFLEAAEKQGCGAIHPHVDPAETRHGKAAHSLHGRIVRHIGGKGQRLVAQAGALLSDLSSASAFLETSTSRARLRAKPRAVALPMALEAPVTTTMAPGRSAIRQPYRDSSARELRSSPSSGWTPTLCS